MADAHTISARPVLSSRTPSVRDTSMIAPRVTNTIAVPALVTAPAAPVTAAPPSWNLTPQQWRVFLLVGRALSNKAIAHELKVAESTVKAHISAIFKVSGCRNRTEAALLSLRVRYGLLEPETDLPAPHSSALNSLRRAGRNDRNR